MRYWSVIHSTSVVVCNLGNTYYLAGRFAESEATYRKLLEIEPDFEWTRPYLGKTLLAQGKPEAALAIVQQATEDARLLYLPVFLQAVGRQAEADEALMALIARWGDDGRVLCGPSLLIPRRLRSCTRMARTGL